MKWDGKYILRRPIDHSAVYYEAFAVAATAADLSATNFVQPPPTNIRKEHYQAKLVEGSSRKVRIAGDGTALMCVYLTEARI